MLPPVPLRRSLRQHFCADMLPLVSEMEEDALGTCQAVESMQKLLVMVDMETFENTHRDTRTDTHGHTHTQCIEVLRVSKVLIILHICPFSVHLAVSTRH